MLLKEDLRRIVITQRGELSKLEYGVEREELENIDLAVPFAIVVSGIRRCGKSTLLRQVMKRTKNFYYINFEDPRLTSFDVQDFQKLEEIFHEEYGGFQFYFFDEIQNIDKWEFFVRHILEKGNHVLITGSNASLLSKELGTKLTGRHLRNELFPFSYQEFLKFRTEKAGSKSFGRYIMGGGFPEYLKYGKDEILQELFNDIVMRDIVVRHNLRSTKSIKEMALFLLTNIGTEFSYNNLAKIFNLGSTNSAVAFVSYLEDSYMLFTVPKFDYSLKKQAINHKKIYSVDLGLSRVNSISFSRDDGKRLENAVYLDLRRRGKQIYYFRGDGECDFLIKEKTKISKAIQVCYKIDEQNKEREIGGLVEALEEFKLSEGLILTYDQEDTLKISGKTIYIKPVWKWSLEYPMY